jgi:hypothetical protein
MARQIDIEFQIHGMCFQTIEMRDDCDLTSDEVVDKLNNGEIGTSTSGNLQMYDNRNGGLMKPIGRVVNQYFDAEYDEFGDNTETEDD